MLTAPSRLPDPFSYGKSDLDPNIGHFSPSGNDVVVMMMMVVMLVGWK